MPSGKKPTNSRRSMPREGISTRPTDSSGRRATDADLDMRAAGERPAVKYKPAKMPDKITRPTKIKPVQVIRTTTAMKSTPTAKKR